MCMIRLRIGICGLALVLFGNASATAQVIQNNLYRNPYGARPAFSPYLNLLRPGTSTTLNYYGLVRPQQEFRGGIGTLQTELQGVGTALNRLSYQDAAPTQETGHPVGFLTHNYNFMTLSAGGTSAGRQAGSRSSQIQSSRPSSSRGR